MTFNFNAPYNRENWITFLRQQFLPQDYSHTTEKVETEFKPKYIGKTVLYLGHSKTLKLKVYEMYHDSENDPRIGLSRDAFKFIEHQKVKNALIFFVPQTKTSEVFKTSEVYSNYRLSLITRELKLEGKKVTKEFTNPKRYSYFIGPEVKKHTIEEFLVKKGSVKDEEDLKSRFSVEIVNKEFYNNIAELFTELVGGVRKVGRQTREFEPLLKLPDTTDHTLMQEFAVRLIGRIVFCWFLKKKKSENGISLIPEEVLSVKAIKNNYYHKILEPLFFEVMNTPIDERKERFSHSERSRTAESFPVKDGTQDDIYINWSSIPFLNGGLFDPNLHNDYYKFSPMEKEYKPAYNLKIPDAWFIKLFSVLELYNFTIDENTSVDIDLSVDPEMLGRIFENLLAEINPETMATARKSTGSYYTPRPIVEYMVDESLTQYLLTNLESFGSTQDENPHSEKSPLERGTALAVGCVKSLEQKIRNLLDYTIEENELTKEESLAVIEALDKIKILDPACGSGAFPMGILQKMLLIRQKVDPESIEWVMKQLEMIPDILVRKAFEEKLMDENWDYKYKMSAILHSIYGVDIQTIAVELSKLRFFLTLMVDETVNDKKPNRGINELPNLSFKFVAANTLIGLPEAEKDDQMDLMDFDNLLDPMMKKLEYLREKFFYASGKEKTEIEKEFKQTQTEIGQFLGKEGSTNKRAVALANWDPFADRSSSWFDPKWMFGINDGFDIVIANPPYIVSKDKTLRKIFENSIYGRANLYGYFIHMSIEKLVSKKGVICFINPRTILTDSYFSMLRKLILKKTKINNILNIVDRRNVFESVLQSVIINIFSNTSTIVKIKNIEKKEDIYNSNFLLIDSDRFVYDKNNNPIFLIGSSNEVYNIFRKISKCNSFEEIGIKFTTGKIQWDLYREYLFSKPCPDSTRLIWAENIQRYFYKKASIRSDKLFINTKLKKTTKLIKNKTIAVQRTTAVEQDRRIIANIINPTSFGNYPIQFENNTSYIEYLPLAFEKNHLVLSLLNSKFFDFIFRHINSNTHVSGGELNSLPFPNNKLKLDVVSLGVTNIVDQILIDKKAGKDTQKLEDKIDLMVYKLYELSYEEVKVVDPETALLKEEYEQDLS